MVLRALKEGDSLIVLHESLSTMFEEPHHLTGIVESIKSTPKSDLSLADRVFGKQPVNITLTRESCPSTIIIRRVNSNRGLIF